MLAATEGRSVPAFCVHLHADCMAPGRIERQGRQDDRGGRQANAWHLLLAQQGWMAGRKNHGVKMHGMTIRLACSGPVRDRVCVPIDLHVISK